MDHCPYPKDAVFEPIAVPYVCGSLEDYDDLGFLDYPVRRGWTRAIHSTGWTECSPGLAAQRAQNWLYFGLLREVLGSSYEKEIFAPSNSVENGLSINISHLRDVIFARFRLFRQHGPKSIRQNSLAAGSAFERLDEIFREADLQSDTLDARYWQTQVRIDAVEQGSIITCAIKVLIDTTREVIASMDDREDCSWIQFNVTPPRILVARMDAAGWCHHQMKNLVPKNTWRMNYYLSGLSRKRMNVNHRACNGDVCLAHHIDLTNYKVRHVQESCRCQGKGADATVIASIIRDDQTPLVSLMVKADGNPHLEIIKAEEGIEYTAISHVWSGGLGNPQDNKLPCCQLVQIHRYLNELDEYRSKDPPSPGWFQQLHIPLFKEGFYVAPRGSPGWARSDLRRRRLINGLRYRKNPERYRVVFWMDTICVPLGEANASLRNSTIRNMDLIYAAAQCTLVLDPELQQTPLKGMPQEQLNVQVMCSAWMTRCWTLQEARLSREWYAQFTDGLYDPNDARLQADMAFARAERKPNPDDATLFLVESVKWLSKTESMQRSTVFTETERCFPLDMEIFTDAWNELASRSTSKAEDVAGILTNLIHLRAGEVVVLPNDQRMKAIIRAHQVIPMELLYSSLSKIQDSHDRWVPSVVGPYPLYGDLGEIKITAEGMIFPRFPASPVGFLVAPSLPRLDKFRLIDLATSEVLWVNLAHDGMSIDFACSSSIATCYIIGDLKRSTRRKTSRIIWKGARFSVQKEEGLTMYLKYEYSLLYTHHNPGRLEEDEIEYPSVMARRTADDQIFRLDCGEQSMST